jgi:hypothetical protein
MRTMSIAAALGTALALCPAAQARHHPQRAMHLARVPIVTSDPTWRVDYNIVPRYRYRPQDDRVDTSPDAPPVAPGDIEPGGPGPSGW